MCPNCSDCGLLFSKGGGKRLADHCKLEFLGDVPIDPSLCQYLDTGTLSENRESCVSYQNYCKIVSRVLELLSASAASIEGG